MDELSRNQQEMRIMEQRKSKKDLSLGPQPTVDKILFFSNKILHFQMVFVVVCIAIAAAFPTGGRLLGMLVSPLAGIVFFLHPQYIVGEHFQGAMGDEFYRNIAGETFFVGSLLGVLVAGVFCGRYWRRPWRLSQFMLERMGTQGSWVATVVLILVTTPLCFGFWFVTADWYGFFSPDIEEGQIALHQLCLWALFASVSVYGFVIFFFTIISAICLLFKKMINCRT